MPTFDLSINGFSVKAFYSESCISRLLIPYLQRLTALQKKLGRRIIVFLAAPPGCGKSTLAAFLEQLSRSDSRLTPLQAAGLDGFHYSQSYLASHTLTRDGVSYPMSAFKGCPDTFDTQKLFSMLSALRQQDLAFPLYDRSLHDVVEAGVELHENMILLEGNWLLLDTPGFRPLQALCDDSLFLKAREGQLRSRLIERKIKGGFTPAQAEAFFERADGPNIALCLGHSLPAQVQWTLTEQGDFTDSGSE